MTRLAIASFTLAAVGLALSSFALGIAIGRHIERAGIEQTTEVIP
jgi:hypothetical protein